MRLTGDFEAPLYGMLAGSLLASSFVTPARAQSAASAETLDRVVVTATRLEGVSAFDTPASTHVVSLGDGGARAQAALSEVLDGIPGLLARERQNLAMRDSEERGAQAKIEGPKGRAQNSRADAQESELSKENMRGIGNERQSRQDPSIDDDQELGR